MSIWGLLDARWWTVGFGVGVARGGSWTVLGGDSLASRFCVFVVDPLEGKLLSGLDRFADALTSILVKGSTFSLITVVVLTFHCQLLHFYRHTTGNAEITNLVANCTSMLVSRT